MPYCKECKCECEGEWVDFGIGSYEYWGARGNDVQWHYVSKCCEGDVCEDEECKVSYDPPSMYGDEGDDYPDEDDMRDKQEENMDKYFEEMEKENDANG